MFTFLGKSIAKRPVLYVVLWLLLFFFGMVSALTGFGQGNVFQRIESSTSLVPGTDSDVVVQKTSVEHAGSSLTAIVSGVSLADAKDQLTQLRTELTDIENVDFVADPLQIDAEFQAELAKQKKQALTDALQEAEPQITAAIAQAKAAQAQQLQYLPDSLRVQAEAKIADEVRATVSAQITAEAGQKIDAELAKIKNPTADFTPESDSAGETGFALLVQLTPGKHSAAEAAIKAALQDFQAKLRADGAAAANVGVMSTSIIADSILDQVASDLVSGEVLGLPIALLLMIFVFGGVLAAGLPLTSALVTIGIALSIIWALTFVTSVDSFILNILSIIGIALSIDYGLLVVSRFREIVSDDLASKFDFPQSAAKIHSAELNPLIRKAATETVQTAGRTVSFSAITIAVSIAGLFMIRTPMMQMIAIGGVVVTLFAVFTAVTFVPALIILLGTRLVQPSPLGRIPGFSVLFKHLGDASAKHGVFSRLAKWVHARPWSVLIVIATLLIIAILPVRNMELRADLVSYVPDAAPVSQVLDQIDEDYPNFQTPDVIIYTDATADQAQDLGEQLAKREDVTRVADPSEKDTGFMISVFTTADDPVGSEVTQLVQELRDEDFGFKIHVGGAAAMQLDFLNVIKEGAPYAAILIVLAVFVLLFLLTGSIVVPLKALVINTISLLAAFGITVFIFQHGLFGMPVRPGLETFVVACIAAFGFGLAMDYEVFLIARIKEYWDAGLDNDSAVEHGLQQSGRIITAAAAIIVAVFVGFSFGELLPIKEIGVALAVIVVVDATLVRMLLVPALMTLMGKWNWWAPKPLLKFYEKFKIVH